MNFIIPENFPTLFQLEYNAYMNIFNKLLPVDLYHTYIVEGDPSQMGPLLLEYLYKNKHIEKGGSDLLYQTYDSFTVNDSAQVKEWHSNKGVTDGKRVCVIATKFINHEAEKSLLKMLEEPATNTHFFIIIPNASVLLDTIRSRAHVVTAENDENIAKNSNAKSFLASSPKDRIEYVAEVIKKNKENEGSGGLRSEAIELIDGIERIIYQKLKTEKNKKQIQFVLGELSSAREYLGTPGASVKMILEHIALVI